MANRTPYGFRWIKGYGGSLTMPTPIRKRVASEYQATLSGVACDLGPGDPVKLVNDGTVAIAEATNSIFGVVLAVEQYWNSSRGVLEKGGKVLPGGTKYTYPETQESILLIVPAAGQVFEIVCDDATTAATRAAYVAFIEENCDISINQDATTKRAYPKLDISDHKTATAQCRIIGLAERDYDVDYSLVNVPLQVLINEVQQAPYVTGGV